MDTTYWPGAACTPTSVKHLALQALEALEKIKAGEQFATVSSACWALSGCAPTLRSVTACLRLSD